MDYTNDATEWNYTEEDIAEKFLFFNVLKDGRIHVLAPAGPGNKKVPPTDDVVTGVKIKDVQVSPDVAVRMFLPPSPPSGKLPVLLYTHGGAFCFNSAFSVEFTSLLTSYVAQSNVLAVSVENRLFPAHSGDAGYEDSWTAFRWIVSHGDIESQNFESGSCDPWIRDYADLNRIFLAGDSSGANINHFVLSNIRKTKFPLKNAKVEGMIMVHPFFCNDDVKMFMYMCPENEGPNDPRMRPAVEDLANLSCDRVLVFIGEKDVLRYAGVNYVEELKKSGWKGTVEVVENRGKTHCFHISNQMDDEAFVMNRRISSFIHNVQVDD